MKNMCALTERLGYYGLLPILYAVQNAPQVNPGRKCCSKHMTHHFVGETLWSQQMFSLNKRPIGHITHLSNSVS